MAKDSFAASLLKGFMAKNNQRRMINNVNRENLNNRGIVNYRPSQIEAFFDSNDSIENIIVSGGTDILRARAVVTQAICAYNQGFSVIVLHENDTVLQNQFNIKFAHTGQLKIIDRNNPYYEPFLGLSNPEISRMVIQSQEKNQEIHSQGRYYLDAMSEYIKSRGITPYCDMFINCPHYQIFDKISDAEMNGKISTAKASQIKTMLMQGQAEQSNIEEYFYRLQHQAGYILAKKSNLNNATNILKSSQNGEVLMIDILSSTNTLLLELLLQDTENALTRGHKLLVIYNGIPLYSSENLMLFSKSNAANCKKVFSSEDVYSMLGGEENNFTTVVGNASKIILYSHRSGLSCGKWADVFGQYDMRDITQTMANGQTKKSIFDWAPDTNVTSTLSVSTKREYIVKPEELNRMSQNEAYIYDSNKNELSHTTVV